MPSKKYYTDSEKEKIYTIVNIKETIIALERDVTKIHQNLKTIAREIYYLYTAMAPEDLEKMFDISNFPGSSINASPEQ